MAVTLAFHRIQLHFSRRIRDKCSIPNSPQSPDIGQNSDVGISDFRISGQFILKDNCHNSGSSYDIDIKLGFMAHLEQPGSRIPRAWSVKLTFSLIVIFYLVKAETELKNI